MPANIKATSYYKWESLQGLRPSDLGVFDFTNFIEVHGADALDAIFPLQNRKGKLNHPKEYLGSRALVRQWRQLRESRQCFEIDHILNLPPQE